MEYEEFYNTDETHDKTVSIKNIIELLKLKPMTKDELKDQLNKSEYLSNVLDNMVQNGMVGMKTINYRTYYGFSQKQRDKLAKQNKK